MILTERFILYRLNSSYLVLLELTDNLFNLIHENLSLIMNVRKAD